MNKILSLTNYLTNYSANTFIAFEKAFRNDIATVVNNICQRESIFIDEDKKDLKQELLIKLYTPSIISQFDISKNSTLILENFKRFLYTIAHFTGMTCKRKISKYAKNHYAIDVSVNESNDDNTQNYEKDMQSNFEFETIYNSELFSELNNYRNSLKGNFQTYFDMLIDFKINGLSTREIELKYNVKKIGSKIHLIKCKIKKEFKLN